METTVPTRPMTETAVPAVERALDLIEHLSRHADGLTLSQLSIALDLPKNAIFRIAHTLAARGYLKRDPRTLRFGLTGKFLSVGQPRRGDVSLVERARGPMCDLRDETGETVQLGVMSGDGGVIIDQVEGRRPLRIAVDIGLRFKLHNNAPGKLLLAWQDDAERSRRIAQMELTAETPRTIRDREELLRECRRIVNQGYSTDWAEADEGVHCVAAPILGASRDIVATVWVSAPAARMPKDAFPSVARLVMRQAQEISREIES